MYDDERQYDDVRGLIVTCVHPNYQDGGRVGTPLEGISEANDYEVIGEDDLDYLIKNDEGKIMPYGKWRFEVVYGLQTTDNCAGSRKGVSELEADLDAQDEKWGDFKI